MTLLPSGVLRLLSARGPSHVAGLVVSVVVDAVDAVLIRWPRADVREERLERALPFVAYRNAARAVELEGAQVRIAATRAHVAPRDVFGREKTNGRASIDRLAVSGLAVDQYFARETAARDNFPACDAIGANRLRRSAIALESPSRMTSVDRHSATNDGEAAVALSGLQHVLYFTSKAAA